MKTFDDSIVRFTQDAVRDNKLKNIKEVRMTHKRRWHRFTEAVAVIMSTIALLACFSWFDIGWPARVVGIVALTSFALIAFGEDDEEGES